jgi:hypothetical protein
MSTTTFSPPEGLPAGRRVYPALVVPFGEAVDTDHEDAPRVFGWGDLKLPRGDVPVDVDHDGQTVGLASGFVQTRDGIWSSLKLGETSERLVRQGRTALSVEIVEGGEIVAVSLVRAGRPGFRSARLIVPEAERELFVSDTAIVAPMRPAADMAAARRFNGGFSMQAVYGEVADRRRRFAERRLELGQQDAADEESRLLAAGVPTPCWPTYLPARQRWEAFQARQAAEEAREYEGRRASQLLAFQLAAAAVAPPKRSWWRWFR